MTLWIITIVVAVVLWAAAAYDLINTRRCIVAGVAEEGNTWLVGKTPSAKALWLRELLQSGPLTVACVVFAAVDSAGGVGIVATSMAVFAVKHFRSGRKGARFLEHRN